MRDKREEIRENRQQRSESAFAGTFRQRKAARPGFSS
jgi:hypothetical protein